MSEEKPEKPNKNPNSFFSAMTDLLKSVIAFLSESSLLKLLAGKGAISGEKRFWAYFISNGILGYDALAIIVLWRTPPDKFIPALLIISILLIALVFLLFLWNKHETKQKKNSSRSNITIYLMVKDKADQEPLDGAKITGDAVQLIEESTKKNGRANITIANTSEQITLTVKKDGYRSENHKLTDEDKEQGHLITVELQKIKENPTPVKRIQEKNDSASESNSDLNGSQNPKPEFPTNLEDDFRSNSTNMKKPSIDFLQEKSGDWLNSFRETLQLNLSNVNSRDEESVIVAVHESLKRYAVEITNMNDIEELLEIIKEDVRQSINERVSDDEFIFESLKDYLSLPKHIKREKRYRLGEIFGRRKAYESEIFEFTDIIERQVEDTIVKFKAMKFLVTNELFSRYSDKDTSFDESTRYYPYQLPYIDNQSVKQLIGSQIDPFMRQLEAHYEHKFTFRLPTYKEWRMLATKNGTDEGWTHEILKQCNFPLDLSNKGELCATGIFRNGVSDVGCFDVVGNAWELCTDDSNNDKYYFVGASYEIGKHVDPTYLNWWLTKEIFRPDSPKDHCISFRVIQEIK